MTHKNKLSAFTLIELLVVIAIIAILAAILFPVFAQAKLAAKKASSLSNIQEIGTAFAIYTNDYDDMYSPAEAGSGGVPNNVTMVRNWATFNYPYMKSGNEVTDADGGISATGCGGIVQDTVATDCPSTPDVKGAAYHLSQGNAWYPQGFSYGVNIQAMPSNAYSDAYFYGGNNNNPNVPITTTQLDDPTNKIIVMGKGLNAWASPNVWNYPWFIAVEYEWLGAGVSRVSNGAWIGPDGDDSANASLGTTLADGFYVNPAYDTDCNSGDDGAWECAAHARYRYDGSTVASFGDTHAKTIHKGGLQWYKNLYIDNPGLNPNGWFSYEYQFTPQ